MSQTSVSNSYATGTVTAPTGDSIGGLIGQIQIPFSPTAASSVINSFATANVDGGTRVGGLIGGIGQTTVDTTKFPALDTVISNSYATGTVKAESVGGSSGQDTFVGGLIGYAAYTNISGSSATGAVTITSAFATSIGGLVGRLDNGSVTNSQASGNVNGLLTQNDTGGLVGTLGANSSVSNSSASGNVTGGAQVGGLVGRGGPITDSSASGNVTGNQAVGGLVGSGGDITGSSATGKVTGNDSVGGLAGLSSGNISGSWASGLVTGGTRTGGLVGQLISGSISNSFWNIDTTGQRNAIGVTDPSFPTSVNNVQGLSNSQFADLPFYLNGTINQVLADRAAAALAAQQAAAALAAQQAAVARQAASVANVVGTTDTQISAATPPTSSLSTAGTKAVDAVAPPAVEDNLKTIENNIKAEEQRRRRRLAATTGTRQGGSGRRGGNFGATIRSIDVDGQRFNLQNGVPKPDAPAQPPQ